MGLLNDLQIEDTRELRHLKQPVVSFSMENTGETQLGGLATQTRYVMRLGVEATFWANKAQYLDAERAAERVIINELYKTALRRIDIALHAISNDDKDAAILALTELRTELVK